MKKDQPQKHPYNQLTYTQDGKTVTVSVKASEVGEVKKMTDSYRELRQLTLSLGQETSRLFRECGSTEASQLTNLAFENIFRRYAGLKPESAKLRNVTSSRDKWKETAKSRNAKLEKNRVKIRDISESHDNWKEKSLTFRKEIEALNKSLSVLKQEIAEAEKHGYEKKGGKQS